MTLVSHVRLFVRQWNNFFVCFDICFFSFVFILEKDCKKELDNNAFIVSRRARPSFGVVSQVKFHLNRLVILWWLRFSSVKIGLFGFMKKPVLPPLLPVLRQFVRGLVFYIKKKKKKKKKWTAFLWFPVTFVALKFLILSMRNTFAEKIEILGIDTAKWRKAKFCVL